MRKIALSYLSEFVVVRVCFADPKFYMVMFMLVMLLHVWSLCLWSNEVLLVLKLLLMLVSIVGRAPKKNAWNC